MPRIDKDKIEINNKRYIKQGGWECTYYIFFFFDLGLIGAAMLVLIVLGIKFNEDRSGRIRNV